MNINEIISLSDSASATFAKRLMSHTTKGNQTTEIICRSCYLENHFRDGSFIEIAVVRDFNDDYKPTHVVLTEYTTSIIEGVKRYNVTYTERFEINEKMQNNT